MNNIINLKTNSGKWITPWGHEFDTEKESKAFVEGMRYVSANVSLQADMLIERARYSKNVKDDE